MNRVPTIALLSCVGISFVNAAHAATPTWGWSADGVAAGDLTEWDPAFNTTSEVFDWSGTGTKRGGSTNFATISEWVNSPNYILDDQASDDDSWALILGDTITKQDASWEMVFRPNGYVGKHTLFNTGGNGDGTAFVLDGTSLEFRFQDGPSADQRAFATFDLSTLDADGDEFFHVVGIADLDNPGNEGTAFLWVNGQLRSSASSDNSGTAGLDDWDGGDDANLGTGNNIPGGNPFGPDLFDGDIATFNFYGNEKLSGQEILDNYNTVASASGLNLVQTTGWTDVVTPLATAGDYYGTVVTAGANSENGTNASGAFSGAADHTNDDNDDAIGWKPGDYVFEGDFTAQNTPGNGAVLAKMDLVIPAGATDIDLTLLFNQDMEGTLEPDDQLRVEIYDVIGDTVLASLDFADDPTNTNPSGVINFSYGDTPEMLQSLDHTGLTQVQARLIFVSGWADGDQEEIQIGDPVFKATYTLVPEPSSLALIGLGGLLIARRRR